MQELETALKLNTVCQGKLEEAFQDIYPALIASMKPGDKAGIGITMEFKRVEETDTMVSVSFKITPKFPVMSKASICQVTQDNKLKTDKPVEQVDFLRRHPEDTIENFEPLLAAVQTFKVATQISGEFGYEDSNNIRVVFKMGEKEGSVHLPKVLYITVPLIYGSAKRFTVEIELEFTVPKAENEKPMFKLTVPKWERYWKDAVDHEVSVLKNALGEHLILDGRGL